MRASSPTTVDSRPAGRCSKCASRLGLCHVCFCWQVSINACIQAQANPIGPALPSKPPIPTDTQLSPPQRTLICRRAARQPRRRLRPLLLLPPLDQVGSNVLRSPHVGRLLRQLTRPAGVNRRRLPDQIEREKDVLAG